jgi:alpha-ketoglutarate-dependent taurine dioxygenase
MTENPWKPGPRHREPAELMKPIVDPAGWYPDELRESGAWYYRVSDEEIADLFDAVAAVEARQADLKDVTKDDFPLTVFGPAIAEVRDEVLHGRGFAFFKGIPVEGRSRYQNAAAFWGIGAHMGTAISQNARGHLLGHVKNIGGDINSPTGRGYNSPSELSFHADSADVLSLMCLTTAKSGGRHRIASSVTTYNEVLKRRPDLADELSFRFYVTLRGELPPGQSQPWGRKPVVSVKDGYFAARGASSTIKRGQELPGVPKLTPAQSEAIAMYQAISAECAIEIDFEPGDISYVNNHVTLHARTAYEDWPEPERARHLFRLWLDMGDARPLDEDVWAATRGIICDGTILNTPLEAA